MTTRQDDTAAQLVAGHVKAPSATPDTSTTSTRDGDPPQHAIAAEAYALWADRGYQDGTDTDDWFEAERRLRRRGNVRGHA